jgi:hypothetical protein
MNWDWGDFVSNLVANQVHAEDAVMWARCSTGYLRVTLFAEVENEANASRLQARVKKLIARILQKDE